jgi:hypothetical protein
MPNTNTHLPIVMPEVVDLDKASPAFRRFYEMHFVDSTPILRGDEDWQFAKALSPDELALARRLVRANLHLNPLYGDSAAVLNDREAIPVLHDMLARARDLSQRITIARPLWILERSPAFPPLIEELVHGKNPMLKERHIFEVLLLADARALDHLFDMARDPVDSVRNLALFHLTSLTGAWKGGFRNNESQRPQDLPYFEARRHKWLFRWRALRELRKWHDARPLM